MADGEAIDWGEVERRLARLPEAEQAAGLRLIQALGQDRRVAPVGGTAMPPGGEATAPGDVPLALRLQLALAGLQVICAPVGFLAGPPGQGAVPAPLVLATALVFGGAGVVLVRAGRQDRRTLSLAGFFLCVASAASLRFLSVLTELSPVRPVAVALNAFLPETFLPFLLWRFTREFPRVLRLDRWAAVVQGAVWTSSALGLLLFSVNAFARLAAPPGGTAFTALQPLLRLPSGFYWLSLSLLCLPAPFIAWRRSRHASEDERRRVRWFLSGLAFGVVPLFAVVFAEAASPTFGQWISRPTVHYRASYAVYLPLLTVPFATTYAVVAHRLLGARLVLRNAARLALARGSILALAMLPTGLLLLLLYRQRDRPIAVVATEAPVPLLLALALLAWVLYTLRGSFLHRTEEILVGRRRDSALVLAAFSRDAQNARTAAELALLIRERLDDLVSPHGSALLLRDPMRSSYVAVESGPRSLAAASGLARLAEASPEPVSLSADDRGSLLRWLTADDRQWIADAGAHLIVPLFSSRGETVALLVLGPTRGGLPYTRDDRQAVTAFVAAASLALERVTSRDGWAGGVEAAEEPAGECRGCGRVAPRAEGLCACGRLLAPAAIPYELAGKFRLERVLGAGGMGVVYRASDLALGRQVALKTLPRLGSEALQRLRREARSMAGFLHPNLALIFGAETWRGVPVLVVEYLAGGTLASRLGQPMSPQEVLRLGVDLAGALQAMHGKRLLHRDVKPSNIGFTGEIPKLLDFGLARLREEVHLDTPAPDVNLSAITDRKLRMTLTGQIVGTPLYMSPEALAGAGPSPAHDLWSLHLVLWEALAGRHPFAGISFDAAMRRMAKGEIPDIRSVRPDCLAEVAELLTCGLHPDAHRRLPAAADAREAFLRAAETA